MRKPFIPAVLGLLGALAVPVAAFAQTEAYTNSPVNLMSGPGDEYPPVVGLPPNQPVTVMGCLSTNDWCDVALPDLRGWIDANALNYPYQGTYVPLGSYVGVIGLPVVAFSIDAYWGHYYSNRPWYNDRARWRNEPPHGYPSPHEGRPKPEPHPMSGPGPGPAPHPTPGPGAGQPSGGARPYEGAPGRTPGQPQGQAMYHPGAPSAAPGNMRPNGGQSRPEAQGHNEARPSGHEQPNEH